MPNSETFAACSLTAIRGLSAKTFYIRERDAIKDHVDAEDKLTRQITASGQRRNMTLINESGLYSLILRSNLESAKKFKRWVTSEVLPSIRKTGSYSVQDEPRWLETRNNTKASHKPFTAAIKLMIEYLKQFGEFHRRERRILSARIISKLFRDLRFTYITGGTIMYGNFGFDDAEQYDRFKDFYNGLFGDPDRRRLSSSRIGAGTFGQSL